MFVTVMKFYSKYLSLRSPLETTFFAVPRFAAIICGFWPIWQPTRCDRIRFIVSCIFIAIGALGENLYGFIYLSELTMALEAFCPGVTKFISLLKMVVFFIYRKDFFAIIDRMRTMMFNEKNPTRIRILSKEAAISSIVSFILLLSGSITNATFSLRPIVSNVLRAINGQERIPQLPFNIILPKILLDYPFYPFTFIILTFSGAMTVFTFSAVDGFFLCSCMYTCGLFKVLQNEIQSIFEELDNVEISLPEANVVFRKKLSFIVERHVAIFDLCADFTDKFALIILMHFVSAGFVLCLSILDLMLNSASIGLLVYFFYSIAALTQLFVYCIGGNYVTNSSLEVADTIYKVHWYKCDVQTRKMILMIMRRAQRPTTISGPFFTPSLPTFRAIISTAGSYIALLKTFL